MKVIMKVSISGTRNGQPWPPRGAVVELPDAEAASMCASGKAIPVPDDHIERAVPDSTDVETRTVVAPALEPEPAPAPAPPPGETATDPKPRRRGRARVSRDADSQS